MAAVLLLVRMLVAEEARPDPRAFTRYDPPDGLHPSEEKYVEWAGGHVAWVIKVARVRSIRSNVVAMVSGVSALAITLVVAVHAPAWVAAALGFVAAAGQFFEGRSRDREQSQIGHLAAVRLQKTLRDFHTDVGELSGHRLRERFKEFRRTFESIKEEYGLEAFRVRSQEPPPIGDGSR